MTADDARGPSPALSVVVVLAAAVRNRAVLGQVAHTPVDDARFTVVTLDGGIGELAGDLEAYGVRTVGVCAPGLTRAPLAVLRMRRLLRTLRPDVVHTHLFIPSLIVELARATLRRPPASVISRHHNLEHHRLGKHLHVVADQWVSRRATAVVAVSSAVRGTLVDREGLPPDRIHVVHNGFDWERTRTDPVGVERWRRRLGAGPIVLAAGRIDPVKDLATLVSAVALVRRSHPTARLVVAGEGSPARVADLRAHAADLAVPLELVGHVTDVFDLMAAADVFAQASVDESFGQTIAEAMSLGVPVVTTTSGGQAEIVGDDHDALVPGDPDALARRITAVLDEPARARDEAAAAARRVRSRFSIDDQVAAHLRIYRAVSRSAAGTRRSG